jgi:hypothetical protein
MDSQKSQGDKEPLSRENYDYMMDHDVPRFLDSICQHLLTEHPENLHRSVAEYLRAVSAGHYRGGIIVAGENVGGGWVRVVDTNGKVRAEIDRLSFSPEGGMQLVASSPKDSAVLIVVNPPGTDRGCIAKYSFTGQHLVNFEFPKAVSALTVDRATGTLIVGLRGGGVWVVQHNGSKLREFQTPTPLAIRLAGEFLWVLTQKAVERRSLSTGQLESAIHLPDTMNVPCSFAVGKKFLWVAAPNADGTANYVGAFDFLGRNMPSYVPAPGCWIRYDQHRGGIWQLARQSNGTLTFHNEKGAKMITADVGKNKFLNMSPDEGSDAVWVLKVDFADECRLSQYDPLRGEVIRDVVLPGTSNAVTHLVPM